MGPFASPSGHDHSHVPNVVDAWAVEANVVAERGQWFVELDVYCTDGVVHHRLGAYFTRRHAEIAASWIARAASRDLGDPAP
jgi:hypothetical protein